MDGVRVSTMQRAESVRTVLLTTRTSTTAETVNSVRIVRASTTTMADRVKEVIVSSVRTVLHTATSRKEENARDIIRVSTITMADVRSARTLRASTTTKKAVKHVDSVRASTTMADRVKEDIASSVPVTTMADSRVVMATASREAIVHVRPTIIRMRNTA